MLMKLTTFVLKGMVCFGMKPFKLPSLKYLHNYIYKDINRKYIVYNLFFPFHKQD